MCNKPQISNKLQELLESECPFAVIRMPGDAEYKCSADIELLPFNTSWVDRQTIHGKSSFSALTFFTSTSRNDYAKRVGELIADLQHNGRKVVISRVIDGLIHDKATLGCRIEHLFEANSDAFCALFRSNSAGTWIVVTPERLLVQQDNKLSTMALAGTRKRNSGDVWDDKNIAEQAFVTRHILEKLIAAGLDPKAEPTRTLSAGTVEHICTDINAIIRPDIEISRIVDSLNPTPAVCGTPTDYAIEQINNIELHARQLYSGVIGVTDESGNRSLFVTLRCAHFDFQSGRFNIYTGGGITGASDCKDEWHETELKAKQLVDLFTPPSE